MSNQTSSRIKGPLVVCGIGSHARSRCESPLEAPRRTRPIISLWLSAPLAGSAIQLYTPEGKSNARSYPPLQETSTAPAGAPRLYSEPTGVHSVFVNGAEIAHQNELTGERPGTVLRSGVHTTTVTAGGA